LKRGYRIGDVAEISPFLVIAATDDRQANHEAMKEARALSVHVSVADSMEECTCWFPAVAENDGYIAGIVSKNGDHTGVKRLAKKMREVLNE